MPDGMSRGGWAALVTTGAFQGWLERGQGSMLVELMCLVLQMGSLLCAEPIQLGPWSWALVSLPCMPLSFWASFCPGNLIPIFCL